TCIVDTGIDYTHFDLGGCDSASFLAGNCSKVLGGYDFVNSDSNPMDDNGHGTHVVGIVASENNTYRGVAPGAKLVALKVCDSKGSCSDADVQAGIDWCVNNASKYNITVISISLGDCSNHNTYCNDDVLASSINLAAAQGIMVSVAAGNCNAAQCPGISCTLGPSSPACVENATAVGAVTDADSILYQRGSLFELFAPGNDIYSTKLGGGFLPLGGTSMATPHVSGAIALLQQFNRLNKGKDLTPFEIKTCLNSTGKLINDSSGSGLLFSRIDIYAAILSLNDVPNIIIYSPTNNSYLHQSFNLNISIVDSSLSISNHSITNSSGNTIQSNSNISINSASFTWTDLTNISNSTFPDGNYTITVFANSTLGNSTISYVNFIVDKTNPSLFAINIAPETIYNNNTVILTTNITDTNLNSSRLYLESNLSGTWTNYSLTLETGNKYNFTINSQNLTNQKNIAYRFHAFDLANNSNSSETYNFTVQNRAPTNLNITSLTNGTVLELGNTYSFNATASDPDSDTLIYLWNFGDGTSYSLIQNSSHQFNSTGNFTILLNVSDSYSSFNLTNITLIVNDTQTPNLTSITYNSSVNLESENNQTVNASVSDPSGIFNLTLYFNNTPQNRSCSSQTNTSWTCSWGWTGLSMGNHNFTINLTDNFTTKHSTSPTYNFTVIGCGDGIKNGVETCDGSDLDGKSCVSQGYASGTLTCSNTCSFNISSCISVSSSSSGGGGGGGGGGSTSSTPICTIGAINCQGSTQYKECIASGTKNAWSEIKEVPLQKECKSGSLIKIEETSQETITPKETTTPKQEKVEETNQSLTLNSDLSAKNPEEKTAKETSEGTSLTGRAVGFIEKVSSGGTLYILIALVILLTAFYLLARKS
ncbi:MAG: S8 family serine peptidase, partial [bacterium]